MKSFDRDALKIKESDHLGIKMPSNFFKDMLELERMLARAGEAGQSIRSF